MARTNNRQMRSVMEHDFSAGEAPNVQRSMFDRVCSHKTTMDAGLIYPLYTDEVLPSDTVRMSIDGFVRLTTPIFPTMDNLFIDIHCWFVAMRHVWDNSRKFFGEQENPEDSVDFVVPQIVGEIQEGSLGHYFGLPISTGAANELSVNALYFRGYNLIWDEHYRDQDLQQSVKVVKTDGPERTEDYSLLRRGKRHDYFTSARPWPLKGGVEVPLPLGERADVKGIGMRTTQQFGNTPTSVYETNSGGTPVSYDWISTNWTDGLVARGASGVSGRDPDIYADLTNATASTVNSLRQAFQIQRMLERDARFGTRYPEHVKAHFDANFEDLHYRPIYLGGGTRRVVISPIAQTSNTVSSGDDASAQGNLAAIGTANLSDIGFTRSFNEHGMIYVLASIRADLTYQRGIDRRWSRRTRYDYAYPSLAHLGEQSILEKEIHWTTQANGERVWGYQERNAEYRYAKSIISGKFDSRATQSLEAWHYAESFDSLPPLNNDFIQESPPIARTLAVQNQPQFISDWRFSGRWARPLPMFGTPGQMDHF